MDHSESLEQVFLRLESSEKGLSGAEAEKRLAHFGKNRVQEGEKRNPWLLFLTQFNSFLIYILIGATLVSALVGEVVDSLVILTILIFNAILGFVQEFKAEKSIDALKKMAGLQARVLRDGGEILMDAENLVPGDVILVQTGDKIPADGRILAASHLKVNESALTGESLASEKRESQLEADTPLGDRLNMVFSGTIVVGGRAEVMVVKTGMQSQIGKIARMIQEAGDEKTPLQVQLDRLGKFLGIAVLIICALTFLLGALRNPEITAVLSAFSPLELSSWLELAAALKEVFMISVALAVAAVPEGLAAVVTVSLALGVQRMVRRNALIRRLPSVETLGSTTVICTDKTGTLTRNVMTVRKLYANGRVIDVAEFPDENGGYFSSEGRNVPVEQLELLLKIGALNNDARLEKSGSVGDPTESCLLVVADKAGLDPDVLNNRYPRLDEKAFDSERKRMTTLNRMGPSNRLLVKGAVDVILDRCTSYLSNGRVLAMTDELRQAVAAANQRFASETLRVLAFACRETDDNNLAEESLVFVGLQAMNDPPRESAQESISLCQKAGIKVVMITGDHISTARAIGEEIGLRGQSLTGRQLEEIEDLDERVDDISIYARVNPEHKLKIVDAFQKRGEVVAMTGDGVNDAPALKEADIGIAMGITGTDVAKEAADMILTDDHFSSIVDAVEEGRCIDDNIRKFVNYLLSSNLGEVLVIFVAMLIGFTFAGSVVVPLTAVQLLWMNIVTDGLPALALGIDPGDRFIMARPPRKPGTGLLSRGMKVNVVVTGTLLAVVALILFRLGLHDGAAKAQTMAFTGLVVFQIIRVYMIRSQFHIPFFSNPYLWGAILISLLLQLFAIYGTEAVFGHNIFGTVPLQPGDWAVIGLAAAGLLLLAFLINLLLSRFLKVDLRW